MNQNDAAMDSLLDELCSSSAAVEEFVVLVEGTYQ